MYTCLVKAIYLYTVTKGRQIFPNFEYLEDNFLNHCAQNVTYRKLREIKKKKNEEKFKLSRLRFLDEIRAIENLRGNEFKLKRKREIVITIKKRYELFFIIAKPCCSRKNV